jgi:hypothetical protein
MIYLHRTNPRSFLFVLFRAVPICRDPYQALTAYCFRQLKRPTSHAVLYLAFFLRVMIEGNSGETVV